MPLLPFDEAETIDAPPACPARLGLSVLAIGSTLLNGTRGDNLPVIPHALVRQKRK